VDPEKSYVLTEELIQSKSKNTPFLNKELKGLTKLVILEDKIIDLTQTGV